MSAIATMLDRTRLGTPQVRRNLTVLPLHVDRSPVGFLDAPIGFEAPDYIPLERGLKSGTVTITEISEGGSVPTLAVRNAGDVAVFILDGEELVGARQNRIVNLSILVPAKTTLPIPVSCVERGRWSYRTRDFSQSPQTMFAVGRAMKMSQVTASLRARGMREADQHAVWASVEVASAALGAYSPTLAMNDVYESRRASIEEYVGGLELEGGQVGAVFAIGGRAMGVELFESAELFAAYFSKIVRGYAMDALTAKDGNSDPVSGAETLLDALRVAEGKRFRAIGLGDDLRIEDAGLIGAGLLLDERVVHLAAFRQ